MSPQIKKDTEILSVFEESSIFAMEACKIDTSSMPPLEMMVEAEELTKKLLEVCSGCVLSFSGRGVYPTGDFGRTGTVYGKTSGQGGLVDAGLVPLTSLPAWDVDDLEDMCEEDYEREILAEAVLKESVQDPDSRFRFLGKFLLAQGPEDDFIAGASVEADVRYMAYMDLSSIVITDVVRRDPYKMTEYKDQDKLEEMLYQFARGHRKLLSSGKFVRSDRARQISLVDRYVDKVNAAMRLEGSSFHYWGDDIYLSCVTHDGRVDIIETKLEALGVESIHGDVVTVSSLADIHLSNTGERIRKRTLKPEDALCLCVNTEETVSGAAQGFMYIPIANNIEENTVVYPPYSVLM